MTSHGYVAPQQFEYNLSFDPSIQVDTAWVDADTLTLLNAQRDNIFMTSSTYDLVILRANKA